jgi:enoyl-CoA hydratase/carnithine racemase
MQSIFNYNTLNATLERKTRTLYIELESNDTNAMSMEMLFELESLLAWTSNKVDIHSILFKSKKGLFSSGHNPNILKEQTQIQIEKMTEKLQKLVQALLHLPQTVVFDLGLGASNIGAELSVGADIRIAHHNCAVNFNHTSLGLVASSCGMSAFSIIIGQANARNFLLTGKTIPYNHLINSGFVFETYEKETREDVTNDLLMSIHNQAPVQRIQTKFGIFENIRESFEHSMKIEKQISKAALMSQDWKNSKEVTETKENSFMKSKSMGYTVKLSLVQDDQSPLN